MKKIIILAGNREQFERHLDENGLTTTECVFGYDAHSIQGIEASTVEIIGTFWDKKDAGELHRLALSRIR